MKNFNKTPDQMVQTLSNSLKQTPLVSHASKLILQDMVSSATDFRKSKYHQKTLTLNSNRTDKIKTQREKTFQQQFQINSVRKDSKVSPGASLDFDQDSNFPLILNKHCDQKKRFMDSLYSGSYSINKNPQTNDLSSKDDIMLKDPSFSLQRYFNNEKSWNQDPSKDLNEQKKVSKQIYNQQQKLLQQWKSPKIQKIFMFNVGILNDLLEILSLKIEEKLAETLFNLYNKLTELIKEEMEFIANQIQQKNEQEHLENEYQKRLEEQKVELNELKIEKYKWYKFNYQENMLKKLTKQDQSLVSQLKIENQKLATEVNKLSEKLKLMEQNSDISKYKQQIEQNRQEFQRQYIELQQKFDKAMKVYSLFSQLFKGLQLGQLTLNNLKSQKTKLETELEFQREETLKNRSLLEIYQNENETMKFQVVNFRERMQMQQEDYFELKNMYEDQGEQIGQLKKRVKYLQSKIDKAQLERSTNLSIGENQNFTSEQDLFLKVRSLFKFNNTFYKVLRNNLKGLKSEEIEKNNKKVTEERIRQKLDPNVQKNKNSMDPQDDTFDISLFSYYQPTFFSLIETKLLQYTQGQPEAYHKKEVSCYFIGQLRGILDSKFNEHQLADNVKLISKFPEFVYDWLSQFQIDQFDRKIVINKNKEIMEDRRIKFYLELTNPVLNKLWEIITFREFLLEKASIDELYFYLHYRNILYQGPTLNLQTSTFQAILYVPWSRADQLISEALKKYEQNQINDLKEHLIDQCQKIGHKQMIDGQIVLRYLLEFYKQERQIRFKLIQDLFFSYASQDIDGKLHFGYENFRLIFINNYPETTELERIQLYRECFSVGQGVVNNENFYAVATENLFFVKYLKLSGQLFQKQSVEVDKVIGDSIRDEIKQVYKEQNLFGNMKEIGHEYGVVQVVQSFQKITEFINNLDEYLINEKNHVIIGVLMDQIRVHLTMILKLCNIELNRKINMFKPEEYQIFHSSVIGFFQRGIGDPIKRILQEKQVKKDENLQKIIKIQRFVRFKIQKWYKLLKILLMKTMIKKQIEQ